MELFVFSIVDFLGTFAFAISGAIAAKERNLDLFGLFVIAFITACGGGILRDLCIGSIPPAGISDWRYLVCTALAAIITIISTGLVDKLKQPVVFFDSLGLGFFAAFGTHKALTFTGNIQVAIILGTLTAVGGGVIRDVLLNRVPFILRKEIYAMAALVGAITQVCGVKFGWDVTLVPWVASLLTMMIRLLALKYSWRLPLIGKS